jgi:A/G-specific adenine glycosylase
VVEEQEGTIPSDPDELMKLPGIGPYTAGAVACFAYERDAAFLDTNMRRILHRYFFGLKAATTATDKELSKIVGKLVPPQRGWRWNPALTGDGRPCLHCAQPPLRIVPAARGLSRKDQGGISRLAEAGEEDAGLQVRGLEPLLPRKGAGRTTWGARARTAKALRCASSARRIRYDFDEQNPHWLLAAVESLSKDGLAKFSSGPKASAPGMVAEERAPYGAGSEESQSLSLDQRVSLP